MTLRDPLLMTLEFPRHLRRIPVSAWVALALVVGAMPWVVMAVAAIWPDLLP